MLTKGAIGNLVNRYRAVLKKCNLINTFGSLAVASMLVMGGAGLTSAAELTISHDGTNYTAGTISQKVEADFIGDLKEASFYRNDIYSYSTGKGKWEAGPKEVIGHFSSYNNNSVTITDATFETSVRLFGGCAYLAGETSNADANNNTVKIDGSGISGTQTSQYVISSGVIGGWGWKDANKNTIEIVNSKVGSIIVGGDAQYGNAIGNTVKINSGSEVQYVYGGTSRYDLGDISGNAENNYVEVKDSTVSSTLRGGSADGYGDAINNKIYAYNLTKTSTGNGFAGGYSKNGNSIGNTIEIDGEKTDIKSLITGGRAQGGGNVENNTVIIKNGTITASGTAFIFGGLSENELSLEGNANKNAVVITGGKITSNIYGGSTLCRNQSKHNFGTANENTVTISGGEIIGHIYGGEGYSEANNNTVTINGVKIIGNVYGGVSKLGVATGNVVNLINAEVSGLVDTGANGTLTVSGANKMASLEGTGTGTIIVDSADTSITASSVSGDFTAKGSAKLNDQTGGKLSAVSSALEGLTGADIAVTGMDEGLISGAVSADGTQKTNTVMQDTLDMVTAAPLAIGRVIMNDVRKRMGDLRDTKEESGVWMRWEGGKLKGDSGLTNNFNTIQIGADTMTGIENVRAGVAAAFTHGDIDHNNGEGENETYSFSAYATWMAENGMFADVIARVGFSNSEVSMKNTRIDLDNEALSLSGEYGWRLPVCEQFFVEPQVELTYTYVTDAESKVQYATYNVDSMDSLIGRAGLVAGWKLPSDMGNVYARASVVHEFLGDAKITGTALGRSIDLKTDGDDTWLEYGIGANVKLSDKTYIWADVERTEGATIEEEWRGTVGLRYSF